MTFFQNPRLEDYLPEWPLPSRDEQKTFFETTHRTCSPEATLERLNPLREVAGITRLSDITYLDCIGIPTYVAVRPLVDQYHENISVYNGKGLTKIQAKVSALMEAFERFSGERNDRPLLLASLDEIKERGVAIDPNRLVLPEGESYQSHELLEWVPGRDLFSGEIRYVPACATFCPYITSQGGKFFNEFSNTTGLASGNTMGEAIAHALCEVIERDAECLSELSSQAKTIDLKTIQNPMIRELIDKFERAGIHLVMKEITSEIGIPSFFAVADEPATEDPFLLCRGVGTHVNAEIAMMRAITEVAQSRCTIISGAREDLVENEKYRSLGYHSLKKEMSFWFEENFPLKNFDSFKIQSHPNFVDDISHLLNALQINGFNEAIVVNLTMNNIQVPVVRVIVPGLEQDLEAKRMGKRAREKYSKTWAQQLL